MSDEPTPVSPAELAKAIAQRDALKSQLGRTLTNAAADRILADLKPADEWRDLLHEQVIGSLITEVNADGELQLVVVDSASQEHLFSASGRMTELEFARQVMRPKYANCLEDAAGSDAPEQHGGQFAAKQHTISRADSEDFGNYQRAKAAATEAGAELVIEG